MFSGKFYEKRLSVRERNMELLLGTGTYTAIKERANCTITTETVMSIMHYKNTTCIIATAAPICIITVKIATHIFTAETVTCIYAAEISKCINATETVTCIIVTERFINIPVTESTTSKHA